MGEQKLKGLFLDLDGTLINSASMINEVIKELFQKYNLGTISKSQLAKFAGLPPNTLFDTVDFERKDDLLKEAVALEDKYRTLAPPYPGITSTLSKISQWGIPMAVISSQARIEMDSVKKSYEFTVFIDFWLSADDVQNPKPDPEGILTALDYFQLPSSRVLFVGDTVYDIDAGKNAGVHTAAAFWGGHNISALTALNPDYCFSEPSQILSLFSP